MTEKKKQDAIAKKETPLSIMEQFQAKTMEIWQDEDAIREMFGKDLSPIEFKYFISLGAMMGANPFVGEIWPVKYDKGKPASIFLGRNFKRRKSQELEDYNGHFVAAVYEKDEFTVVDELPVHKYAQGDRGKLIRAYCIVYKKSNPKPCYHEVKFNEYDKGFSVWKHAPETMLKKVVENQCLTMAFQGTFQGTYDESEQWKEQDPENVKLDAKMEVSTEVVRDHDDTGIEAPPEKTETPVSVEDAVKEVCKQTTAAGLTDTYKKYPSLHTNEDFIAAVDHISANIESEASPKTEVMPGEHEVDPEKVETTEEMAQRLQAEHNKEKTNGATIAQDKIQETNEPPPPNDSDEPGNNEPVSGESLKEKKDTYGKLLLAVNDGDTTKAANFLSRYCGINSLNQLTSAMFPTLDKALSEFAKPK